MEVKDSITHIYYFGAGCSSHERNEIVQKALLKKEIKQK